MRKVSSGTTTRKKVKYIGVEKYINERTGIVSEMNVIEMEDRDANFQKLWLGHILEAVELAGNKKMAVIMWLLKNRDINNTIIASQRSIAKDCEVSIPLVNETIQILKATHFLRALQQGVYILNPDAVFQGGKGARMNVLLTYTKAEDESHEIRENLGLDVERLPYGSTLEDLDEQEQSFIEEIERIRLKKEKLKLKNETKIAENPDTFVQTEDKK